MEEKINQLHQLIKDIFPDAVYVEVIVNSQEIQVNPKFKTNVSEFTMKTITGKWVKRNTYHYYDCMGYACFY